MITSAMAAAFPDIAAEFPDDVEYDEFPDSNEEAGTSSAVEKRNTAVQQAKTFFRDKRK